MEGVRFTEGSLLHAERIAEENAQRSDHRWQDKRARILRRLGIFDDYCQNPSFFEKELRSDAKAQSLVLGMLLNVGLQV